jgi:hypothetical protein
MTNQNFEGTESSTSQGTRQETNKMRGAAGEAFSKASDFARDASEKVKRAAADTASTMTDSVMGLLNEQIGVGADKAGQFASSMRLAADDLSGENPMLAGLVRSFAQNVDNYADRLENQTVEQLAQTASDYTRRQPALVFSLAAIAGFFAFRTYKNARTISSPPIQPTYHDPADHSHG